jgi:hypothetical protein
LDLYQGVSIGGGIGSISDILDASQMIIENVCILYFSIFMTHFILVAIRCIAYGKMISNKTDAIPYIYIFIPLPCCV